jgi:hypothetical protein
MRLGPIELPGLLNHVARDLPGRRGDDLVLPGLPGFPLVELVENRDNPGSSHVFFDLGNRNLLGFLDLPGHEHPPFSETIRGVQHIAILVGPSSSRRREAFDEYLRSDRASTQGLGKVRACLVGDGRVSEPGG